MTYIEGGGYWGRLLTMTYIEGGVWGRLLTMTYIEGGGVIGVGY